MGLETPGFSGRESTPIEVIVGGDMKDGVDNTVNLRIAIDRLVKLGGGICRVPGGTLCVSGTGLQLSALGCPIRIIGAGPGRTTIKHLTGGAVITWAGSTSHAVSEYGSGLEDIKLDGNGGTAIVAHFDNLTLFTRRNVFITNGNGTGTGLETVSMFDSNGYGTFIADCGGGANPCVIIDSFATGGANGNIHNNNREYDLHIEPTNRDCNYIELRGNVTNAVEDNWFFGLKIHGDSTTANPGAGHCLLNLSQFAKGNHFVYPIFAGAKGTAQVICDGQRNEFLGGSISLFTAGGVTTYGYQFTSNADSNVVAWPNVKNGTSYSTALFRGEAGTVHNILFFPRGNFGGVNPYSDAGRNIAEWNDTASNRGVKRYANDGFTDVAPGQIVRAEFINTLTDAATIALDPTLGSSFKVTLGGARTLDSPSPTPVTGQFFTFEIIQDGTGGRALAFHAIYKQAWSDTGNTANKRSIIVFRWNGGNMVQVGAQSPYV